MPKKASAGESETTLETSLDRLEKIVGELESGELALERAIERF